MRLYSLPRRSLFRLDGVEMVPPGAPQLVVGDTYYLERLDGAYSFCLSSTGRVVHVSAAAEVTPVAADGYWLVEEGAPSCA